MADDVKQPDAAKEAPAQTPAATAAAAPRARSKKKLQSTQGIAHIFATFNNTIITITDRQGNAVC